MLIVGAAGLLLSSAAGSPGTDRADSKSVTDAETYDYHGTFNYYYPSPAPTPVQQSPRQKPTSSSSSGLTAVETISTIFGGIFTVALAVIAYAQWKAAQMELRAYLFVTQIEILVPSIDDPTYVAQPHLTQDLIRVHVKNAGKTPAYNVTVIVQGFPTQPGSPLPDNFPYTYSGSTTPGFLVASTIIGPDDSHLFPTAPGPAMTHDMPAVRKGQLWLYVYGDIDYTDVFFRRVPLFSTRKRRTEFCWLYVQGPTPGEYSFQTYKEHNEAT
jgi:hypothetical protein